MSAVKRVCVCLGCGRDTTAKSQLCRECAREQDTGSDSDWLDRVNSSPGCPEASYTMQKPPRKL